MATSKLQRYTKGKLKRHFDGIEIIENTRPSWLISKRGERLELDFHLPSLDVAIEVQGQQHYQFVPIFHVNFAGFKAQIARDKAKRELCKRNGITLIEVASSSEVDDAIKGLLKTHGARPGSWHPLNMCLKRRESVKVRYARMIGREMGNKDRKNRKQMLLDRMNQKLIKYGGEAMTMKDVTTILKHVGFVD